MKVIQCGYLGKWDDARKEPSVEILIDCELNSLVYTSKVSGIINNLPQLTQFSIERPTEYYWQLFVINGESPWENTDQNAVH